MFFASHLGIQLSKRTSSTLTALLKMARILRYGVGVGVGLYQPFGNTKFRIQLLTQII